MLFRSVVLPCQYQTASSQAPVVQWWYKSYCRDRTRESFSLPESLAVQASELGATSHLECSDTSRTVRVVASAQGASLTLAEHYKGRDITIINKADLRIGELQWGDSGVYFCKVVIADDLEGKNEAQVELLVLGRTGPQDDLLPEFDVEIMPEWVFVGSVVLGSTPSVAAVPTCFRTADPTQRPPSDSVYEAGKMAKRGPPAPAPVYPYYIPGVPAVVPLAPSSQVEPKITSLPSVETNLAAAASSLSELSSLHDGGNSDFRHTYQTVQMKALPPIMDDRSLRAAPPRQRTRVRPDRINQSDDELDRRWNSRSEHLDRKTLSRRGRTGSLDELEDFARSFSSRGRRAEPLARGYERDDSPPRRCFRDEMDGWGRRSPSPVPPKRRDTWDSDRHWQPCRSGEYDHTFLHSALEHKARARAGERGAARLDEDSDTPSKGSSRGKGSYYSRSPSNRPEEEDPLPPYSEWEAERHCRADAKAERYRTAEAPRSERYRTTESQTRPFSYTRPPQGASHTLQGGREERDRNRNLSAALSRDSLIV
uniref:Immunoglobulin-like domain containing receptor 2 n=1 Tax=Tetraodon nigroviridis TaxID=99883 RepID=H3C4H0_TETNG